MLRSRKVSKWGKLLSVLLLLTIMLPMAFSASAIGNVTDTAFVLERTGVAKSQVSTPMRGKLDYTSSYAYNVSSNVDFTKVEVRGANSDASPAIYGTQCTYGAYKRLNRGTSSYFPNTVKVVILSLVLCLTLRMWTPILMFCGVLIVFKGCAVHKYVPITNI